MSALYIGAVVYANSRFGQGTGAIILSNVQCSGTELALINCTHSGIGVHSCDHNQDAGVSCLGIEHSYLCVPTYIE